MEAVWNSETFETEVKNADLPVLVDFFADWCAPCQMMAPVVERLAEQYEGKLRVGKVNVDAAQDIAQQYKIRSIPTFLFFRGGEVVDRLIGADPKELENKCAALAAEKA